LFLICERGEGGREGRREKRREGERREEERRGEKGREKRIEENSKIKNILIIFFAITDGVTTISTTSFRLTYKFAGLGVIDQDNLQV
jgi:hypothetical protein